MKTDNENNQILKCQKNKMQLVWSSSASNQTLWWFRKILGSNLDPSIFVVSGVNGKDSEDW